GREMETRSRGTPRMRSASMPLFGLPETRMSFSAFATRAFLPARTECSKRARQTNLETIAGGDESKTFLDELAKLAMHARTALAIGTEAEVIVDDAAFAFAERAVEEKVENAFYIVTAHRSEPSSFRSDDSSTGCNCTTPPR